MGLSAIGTAKLLVSSLSPVVGKEARRLDAQRLSQFEMTACFRVLAKQLLLRSRSSVLCLGQLTDHQTVTRFEKPTSEAQQTALSGNSSRLPIRAEQ